MTIHTDESRLEYPDPDIAANSTSYPWQAEYGDPNLSTGVIRSLQNSFNQSDAEVEWDLQAEQSSDGPSIDAIYADTGSDSDFSASRDQRR